MYLQLAEIVVNEHNTSCIWITEQTEVVGNDLEVWNQASTTVSLVKIFTNCEKIWPN